MHTHSAARVSVLNLESSETRLMHDTFFKVVTPTLSTYTLVLVPVHLGSTLGLYSPMQSAPLARTIEKATLTAAMMRLSTWDFESAQTRSNLNKSVPAIYVSHQHAKKTGYGPRAREVEKAITAVMSTSGGMGKEVDKLSVERGERYSDTVGFVGRKICFDLLRTCVIALRGYKKTKCRER